MPRSKKTSRKHFLVGIARSPKRYPSRASMKLSLRSEDTEHINLDVYSHHTPEDRLTIAGKELDILMKNGSIVVESSAHVYEAKPIIVMEGELLFTDKKLRDRFDLRIYLESPARRTPPGLKGKGSSANDLNQREYAHYIINARQPSERVVQKIRKIIDEERHGKLGGTLPAHPVM